MGWFLAIWRGKMPVVCVREGMTARRLLGRLLIFVATMSVLALAARTAKAQTGQGSIMGRVTDIKGALIAGADVTVINNDTQQQNKTKSNDSGTYNVIALDPGTYSVSVRLKGFSDAVVQNIIVSAASTVETDVSLAVGSETITVTVTAEESLLSNTSDVSTTVDHTLVEELPYPERSALEAVLLVPGVNGDPLQPGGIATENAGAFTSVIAPGASITVGGAAPGGTAFLLDGSDTRLSSYPASGINLSGMVVGESTVITGGMSAKFGRSGSGAIFQSSKSGTDQYHGGVTWSHSDPFLNAFPDGGTARNNLHQNFFGFYLGGPVRIPKVYDGRRKTFFEVGIEPGRLSNTYGFRGTFFTPDQLAGHMNNSLSILDQYALLHHGYAYALNCARAGDANFEPTSETVNGGACLPPSATYQSSLYYQSPVTPNPGFCNNATTTTGFPCGPVYNGTTNPYVPITGPIADCASGYNPGSNGCANDVGPQLAQNPFAQFVLSQMPGGGSPDPYVQFDSPDGALATDGTNADYERGVINIDNRYSTRIDHQFDNSNRLFVRYTVVPLSANRYLALPVNNVLNFVPRYNSYTHDVAIGYTHVFSNNLVGEFHYSFLRSNKQTLPPSAALAQDYGAKYGLTPSATGKGFPNLGNFNDTGATYTIQPGATAAAINLDQDFIGGANFNWTHGTHLIQFGVDFRWYQANDYDLSGLYGGHYAFSQGSTDNGAAGGGMALASFILGALGLYTDTPASVPAYYRWRYYAGYIQDDWRASPRLTINMGLRYDLETPRMEKFNNQAYVTLIPGMLNGQPTSASFCFSGSCGLPKTLWPTNYYGLQPRIGISFAATPRTTLRVSYGLMRLPLTGYDPSASPDPDFNVSANSVGGTGGGPYPGAVDYMTNFSPVLGTSTYTALHGFRGPIEDSTGVSPVYVEENSAVPYIQNWNLTVQFQPAQKTVIQATYQGVHGVHLVGLFTNPINTPPLATIVANIQQGVYLNDQTHANQYGITSGIGSTTPLVETALQEEEPYQNFFNQSLDEIYPRHGSSHYDAFYISVNQRANKSMSFLANYSWVKSLDNVPETTIGTGGGFGTAPLQNPFDLNGEYSVSSFDQPSKFKAGYVFRFPFGANQMFNSRHGWINQIIGNFSTSGIATVASGFPNTVLLGGNGNFISITPQGVDGCRSTFCPSEGLSPGYVLRPNFVPGVPLINKNWKKNPFDTNGLGVITPYLNAAAFTTPGSPGNPQLGNVPRTLANARSPRELFFDAQLSKSVTYRRYQFSLNISVINVLNHPAYFSASGQNLSTGSSASSTTGQFTYPANASFGELNASNTSGISRSVHLGAKLSF